jgi:GntR family transcriptional repressor for pyruvate dehydrogenase complex
MRQRETEFVHAAARAAAERRRALAEGDRGLGLFSSIQTRKVSDEVLGILVDALRGGIYEVGDMLPPERDLAERLGVSRKVLREAIERLRSEGIVSVRRGAGGGTVVESLENLAELCARIQGETRTSLRSLLEIRRPIECTGALLAGLNASDAQRGNLRRLAQLLDEVIDNPKEFWEIDMRFHIAVAEFSGNGYCARFLREIINGLSVIKQQFPYAHVPHQQAIINQRETCEAIVSGVPMAILQSMDAHLADLEYVLLGERLNMSDPLSMPVVATAEPAAQAPSVAAEEARQAVSRSALTR